MTKSNHPSRCSATTAPLVAGWSMVNVIKGSAGQGQVSLFTFFVFLISRKTLKCSSKAKWASLLSLSFSFFLRPWNAPVNVYQFDLTNWKFHEKNMTIREICLEKTRCLFYRTSSMNQPLPVNNKNVKQIFTRYIKEYCVGVYFSRKYVIYQWRYPFLAQQLTSVTELTRKMCSNWTKFAQHVNQVQFPGGLGR